MSPEEQWDFMNELLYKYGSSDHVWEIRLRKIAQQIAANEHAYHGDVLMPFVAPGGYYTNHRGERVRSRYRDVRFRFIPELEQVPEIAQLVAESILRKEIDW